MAYWLLKTEPSDYSYADLERDGRAVWDGVSNNAALKHIRSVRKGDEALVYHTGDERQAVGLARVVSDPYPDRAADDPRLVEDRVFHVIGWQVGEEFADKVKGIRFGGGSQVRHAADGHVHIRTAQGLGVDDLACHSPDDFGACQEHEGLLLDHDDQVL